MRANGTSASRRVLARYLAAARYKSKKTVKTESGEDMVVYEYSDRQRALRDNSKARRLQKLRGNIRKLRERVRKDLASKDDKTRLTALCVALMDATAERVGNFESREERGHVGVTGWQRKHVLIGPKKIRFKYRGKSGVDHIKELSDSELRAAVKAAYKACGEDDEAGLLEYKDGRVTPEMANDYLSEFGITCKDLRGHSANVSMIENLKQVRRDGGDLPSEKTERAKLLKSEFQKALKLTAEHVGHEPATLRSDYLVPNLEESYVSKGEILERLDD